MNALTACAGILKLTKTNPLLLRPYLGITNLETHKGYTLSLWIFVLIYFDLNNSRNVKRCFIKSTRLWKRGNKFTHLGNISGAYNSFMNQHVILLSVSICYSYTGIITAAHNLLYHPAINSLPVCPQ